MLGDVVWVDILHDFNALDQTNPSFTVLRRWAKLAQPGLHIRCRILLIENDNIAHEMHVG